jgi:hypothetical protein
MAVKKFCKYFCDKSDLPFGSDVFVITAINDVAMCSAALLQYLEKNFDIENSDINWLLTMMLIIDETSMFPYDELVLLNKYLKKLYVRLVHFFVYLP